MANKYVKIGLILAAAGVALAAAAAVAGYLALEYRNARWLAEAEAAYDAGDWSLAKSMYERYIPQDPGNTELLRTYVDACLNMRNNRTAALSGATTAYQEILSYEPDNDDVRAALIDVYRKLKSWQAIEYYASRWLDRDPGNTRWAYERAVALRESGRGEAAIEQYNELIDAEADIPAMYGELAELLRDRQQNDAARDVFALALERYPENARIRVDYAEFLALEGDREAAALEIAKAVELDPGSPDVALAQAQEAAARQDLPTMIEHVKRAAELDPGNGRTHIAVARAYELAGAPDKAIAHLSSVEPLIQIDESMILVTLVDLLINADRLDEAAEVIDRYETAYPDRPAIHEYFDARMMLAEGRVEEAIERLAAALEMNPGFLLGQYALALAYIESGQVDLGKSTLEDYVERNPNDHRARLLLAQRFSRPPSLDRAIEVSRKALADPDSTAQRLTALAGILTDSAAHEGRIDEALSLANDLLLEAVRREPENALAYENLVAVALRRGRIDAAEQAAALARKNGVDQRALLRVEAAVALAKGDEDTAIQRFTLWIDGGDVDSVALIDWSRLFARANAMDGALKVLKQGKEALAEDAPDLDFEHVAILVAADRLDEAIEAVAALETITPDADARVAESRFRVAEALLAKGDKASVAAARELVEKARENAPNSTTGKLLAADLALRMDAKDVERAEALLRDVLVGDPTNVRALSGLANIARSRGDIRRALDYASQAAAGAPGSVAIQLLLADVQMRAGSFVEAERTARLVLALDDGNTGALRIWFGSLLERKRTEAAREALKRLEAAAANDADLAASLPRLRAELLLAEGDGVGAEAALREEYDAHPEDPALANALARSLLIQKRDDDAEAVMVDHAEAQEDELASWLALAAFYRAWPGGPRLADASAALTRALLASPNDARALREMMEVRLAQGNVADALALCDRYLEAQPDSAVVLHIKAALIMQLKGSMDEALDAVNAAIAIDDRVEYRATRGLLYCDRGDYDKALEDLEEVRAQIPNTTARVDAALAEIYHEAGETRLAAQYYEAARSKADRGEPVDAARMTRLKQVLSENGA